MSIDKKRRTAVKISKEKVKKIGIRSISDIIHNTKELNFKEKVDYIRHRYTYYDGNYEYFHNAKGKPNSKKYKLNNLIIEILKGKKDPNELKAFNNVVLEWRKQHSQQMNNELQELYNKIDSSKILIENSDEISCEYEHMRWYDYIKKHTNQTEGHIALINEYLAHNKGVIKPEILQNISYEDLKAIALKWDNTRYKEIDINSLDDYIAYVSKKESSESKPYLPLILKYLKAEGENYSVKDLEGKRYKNMKALAIGWAASKKADNDDFDETNLPDLVKEVVNRKAQKIIEQRDLQAAIKMKEYAEDLGYLEKDTVNVEAV